MDITPLCIIPGNPDIAGIGVRASIYAQACLAILAIAYTSVRAYREWQKDGADPAAEFFINHSRLLKRLAITLMLTGAALILSAIIEAKSNTGTGLTVYHVLIVLNLSWINNIAGFSLHFFAWFIFAFQTTDSLGRMTWLLFRDLWAFSAHSTAMSVMGIWFWADPAAFSLHVTTGPSGASCDPPTYYWLFSPIRMTNHKLRIISLIAYSVTCTPLLSTAIHSFPLLFTGFVDMIFDLSLGWIAFIFAAGFISPIVFLIVMTEMLITSNREQVDVGVEDRWTYGQTLALAAAMIAVGFVLVEIWSLRKTLKEGEKDWRQATAKLREVKEGEHDDWIRMQKVAEEVEQVSRRKLLQEQELMSWDDATGLMNSLLDPELGGTVEDWERMRSISAKLAFVSLDAIMRRRQR